VHLERDVRYGLIRVVPVVGRPLLVYSDQRTYSDCSVRKNAPLGRVFALEESLLYAPYFHEHP
jgi:hypothetical protein